MKLGRHTSLEQPLGIDDVLVPESVQCSHADVGGWEIRQFLSTRGSGVAWDVVGAVEVAEVGAPTELVGAAAPETKVVNLAGRRGLPVVDHWVLEELEGDVDDHDL